jgi:hypothetical protein
MAIDVRVPPRLRETLAARPTVRRDLVVVAAAALVAALAFLVVYPKVGLDADSVTYVGVGRNVAAGHGVTYPFKSPGVRMTDFPPGYPLVLGALHAIGLPIVGAAQVLQALMLGLAAALAAVLVMLSTRSRLFAAVAFALVAIAPGLHEVFSTIYTEPLAIGLELGALALLAWYAMSHRTAALVGAAVCAGLGPAVRWAGVSVLATGFIVLLAYGPGTRRERGVRAVLWSACASVPAVVSMLANRGAGSGSGTARDLAWHPVTWSQLHKGFDTIASWFLPRQLPDRWVFGLVLVAALVVAAIAFVARRGVPGAREVLHDAGPGVVVPGLFALVYVVTILVSMSVFDAATPLDVRILSPLYVVVVPVAVGAVGVWYRAHEHRDVAVRTAVFLFAAVFALVGVRALTTATGSQESRLGFAAAHWHRSPLMRHVETLPRGAWVVTNAPEAVYYQTGRAARGLPSKYSSTSLVRQRDYPRQLDKLVADLRAHGGVIAMFAEVKGRPWLPKASELRDDPRLRVVATTPDGVLLAPPQD